MYLKEVDENKPIPSGLYQIFRNKFSNGIAKSEIIKMKNDNILTSRDVEISEFLFKFRFATLNQIYRCLNPDNCTINSIKSRLDKLVAYRVINKFMLSTLKTDVIEQDSLVFYCLDLGGKFLLSNYSNLDVLDWQTFKVQKISEIISKDIVTTEFYLRLREHCPDKIEFFNPRPLYRSEKDKINIRLGFELRINHLGQKKIFLGEIVRESDFPINFRDKSDKLDRLLSTNVWKRYYYELDEAPLLFLVAENDEIIKEAAVIISQQTEISSYRLTSDKRIEKPLDEAGVFLKYVPEEKKLKATKSTIFSK